MLFELARWWYGRGWLGAWQSIPKTLHRVLMYFSVGVLVNTLFAPWKQIISLPGRSLDEKLRAIVDNLVSRTVGFFARFFALLAALVCLVVAGATALITAAAWPFMPLVIAYCLFRSLHG